MKSGIICSVLIMALFPSNLEDDSSRIVNDLYKTCLIHIDYYRQLNPEVKIRKVYLQADIVLNPEFTRIAFSMYIHNDLYPHKHYYYGVGLEQAKDITELVSKKLRSYVGIKE